MTQEEWLNRYRKAFIDHAEITFQEAMEIAGAVSLEEASAGFEDDPEGAALEEMSYWEE